jgi:ubiquinone/menaquinone biosynthesis C-methylase UbiE
VNCHDVAVATESGQMRARRRQRRVLFDEIADRYQASRRGYPPQLVDFVVDTAGLRSGAAVLEVGCGTGQLTELLAGHDLAVTAIDIGAAMVEAARQRVGSSQVSFQAVSFEALAAPDACFDLIVSASAFHWVDPEVKFAKSARLLKPGGWLALLATGEEYDNPLATALREMWMARRDDPGPWVWHGTLPDLDLAGAADFFGPPVQRSHSQRVALPAEMVIGVEATRSTFLSWPEQIRQDFIAELRHRLGPGDDVPLTQQTSLAMVQVGKGRRKPQE